MRRIDVGWDGPFHMDYDRDSEKHALPDLQTYHADHLLDDAYLYAIYGRHPVYGANSLLYIGETNPQEQAAGIRQRLRSHLDGRFSNREDMSVYLGIVTVAHDYVTDRSWIRDVESLLIAAHMPALNKNYIHGPTESAMNLHVVNWGFRGALLTECSGEPYRW